MPSPTEDAAYWAAIVDVKCTWAIRRRTGRPPIPVLTINSSQEELVQLFANRFDLTAYKTGSLWYAHATGTKLTSLLEALQQYSVFRSAQYRSWLALLQHIGSHRGHRHRPLSAAVLRTRERLAASAAGSDPFRSGSF
jgi:hypothetical protein